MGLLPFVEVNARKCTVSARAEGAPRCPCTHAVRSLHYAQRGFLWIRSVEEPPNRFCLNASEHRGAHERLATAAYGVQAPVAKMDELCAALPKPVWARHREPALTALGRAAAVAQRAVEDCVLLDGGAGIRAARASEPEVEVSTKGTSTAVLSPHACRGSPACHNPVNAYSFGDSCVSAPLG